ncbi:MAG: hypothetical protein ACR2J3_13565 [Aridibacter sp.]
MKKSETVTFRVPVEMLRIAERKAEINGEKSVGLWCKEIFVNELQNSEEKTEKLPAKINDIDMDFLLRAIGNTRELVSRSFQMMFELAEESEKYEVRTSDLEFSWNEMHDEYQETSDEQYQEFNALADELKMDEKLIA